MPAGEIQLGVHGKEADDIPAAVPHTFDVDGPENRDQPPPPLTDMGSDKAVAAFDRFSTHLALRAETKMVLEQTADHLATLGFEQLLDLPMIHPANGRRLQTIDEFGEVVVRRGEFVFSLVSAAAR
jgi:hypothetical protein